MNESHQTLLSIPDWLLPEDNCSTDYLPVVANVESDNDKSLLEIQYENMFEVILEKITSGIPLTECLREDIRDIKYSSLLSWIHKDQSRKLRYYEAQEIGAEMVAAEMIEIADSTDSIEDVQRSKLRIDTRRFLVGVWNKKRYSETKQVELVGTISVLDALNAADERLINGSCYEVGDDIQN